ncbi:prephenate dehydrogenase dimerization domain-containing protein [Coprobacillaceae bacterium CR2/5/TPMF4]|nr:prephenate dehydrogenase dimerization domain-containing protein [Coprobacillaceae bacterium CR2/5/TPMF4]
MESFVATLGFKSVKIMSPEAHDEVVSFTSQLPHALAVALINSDNQKYDTGKYIGDSYRDLTRIANINENLWSELFLKNRDHLLASINSFEEQLDMIKQALYDDDEAKLKEMFIESSLRREKLEKVSTSNFLLMCFLTIPFNFYWF